MWGGGGMCVSLCVKVSSVHLMSVCVCVEKSFLHTTSLSEPHSAIYRLN